MADADTTPRDLRIWKKIDPPKHKKDYEGKRIYVSSIPGRSGFNRIPDGSVLDIARRVKEPGYDAWLDCRWPCPACGHRHESTIPDNWPAEGKAWFVEDTGRLLQGGEFLYLASPYEHPDHLVRQQRWLDASEAAAWLMSGGGDTIDNSGAHYTVYSPIAMGHPVSIMGEQYGLGHGFGCWRQSNWAFIDAASHFIVLQIDGWERSVGMREELYYARKRGLPIWVMGRNGDGTWAMCLYPNLAIPGPEAGKENGHGA